MKQDGAEVGRSKRDDVEDGIGPDGVDGVGVLDEAGQQLSVAIERHRSVVVQFASPHYYARIFCKRFSFFNR